MNSDNDGESSNNPAADVTGIAPAETPGNQRAVSIRHVVEFKENLSVLLISMLFITLASRLELSAETFRLSTETSSSSDALDSALDATLSALVGRDAPIEARSHAEPPSGPPHAVPARIESSWSLSGEQTPFRGEHSVGARGDEARGLRLRTRFQLSGEAPGGAPLRIIPAPQWTASLIGGRDDLGNRDGGC